MSVFRVYPSPRRSQRTQRTSSRWSGTWRTMPTLSSGAATQVLYFILFSSSKKRSVSNFDGRFVRIIKQETANLEKPMQSGGRWVNTGEFLISGSLELKQSVRFQTLHHDYDHREVQKSLEQTTKPLVWRTKKKPLRSLDLLVLRQ